MKNDKAENEIVNEFTSLLDKSKILFNGLRDLPQYGDKRWQNHFSKTFDVYTRLWRFQQQNRQVLDDKFGLKRWQIGDIASKIGQIFYHYYLRTSDIYFLNESFAFFSAIRARNYYANAEKEDKPEMIVKKLRYYARYIIVCLLLKKIKIVNDLVREYSHQIRLYKDNFKPQDYVDWELIVQEIELFLDADCVVSFTDGLNQASNRLKISSYPVFEKNFCSDLKLQEVLLVSNCYTQRRFSELSIDIFRILQAFEHDESDVNSNVPSKTLSVTSMDKSFSIAGKNSSNKLVNPNKYLLYKPTYSKFVAHLSASFNDLSGNSIMLVYISADGFRLNDNYKEDESSGYAQGGLVTDGRSADHSNPNVTPSKDDQKNGRKKKEVHCIYPGDFYSFTRKPLFLIIDSDCSFMFKKFPNLFGQPVVCLLSPQCQPQYIEERSEKGNLYTLFLHCPLTALLYSCQSSEIKSKTFDKAKVILESFFIECFRLLIRSRKLDDSYHKMMTDPFLRILVLRHCFANIVLRLHRSFPRSDYYPTACPELPVSELVENPILQKKVNEIVNLFDCIDDFATPGDLSSTFSNSNKIHDVVHSSSIRSDQL